MSGYPQPSISGQHSACDIKNPFHCSFFSNILASNLVVGYQHPDDKLKCASAYVSEQKTFLAQEYGAGEMFLRNKHYPGQIYVPKKCSMEYKRDMMMLKTTFELREKFVEKCGKMLAEMVALSEEHAALCEVPGWNNQTYSTMINACRESEQKQIQPQLSLPQQPVITDAFSSLSIAVQKKGNMDIDV